ncbi:MAG: hypothetical protein OEL89_00260 [Candidatus Peregrinibacteria bacterium]|nr:hypothetical protein [Candidatus Peregrinibacteria bacterium]
MAKRIYKSYILSVDSKLCRIAQLDDCGTFVKMHEYQTIKLVNSLNNFLVDLKQRDWFCLALEKELVKKIEKFNYLKK